MKTLRYRIGKEVRPGILDTEESIRDASTLVSDWDSDNVTVEKLNEIKFHKKSNFRNGPVPSSPRLLCGTRGS